MSNNVISLSKHPKFKGKEVPKHVAGAGLENLVPDDNDNWTFLHKSDYEANVQKLVEEGLIKSGRVEMSDFGIPTVYITLYDDYDQDVEMTLDPEITPGANNP